MKYKHIQVQIRTTHGSSHALKYEDYDGAIDHLLQQFNQFGITVLDETDKDGVTTRATHIPASSVQFIQFQRLDPALPQDPADDESDTDNGS